MSGKVLVIEEEILTPDVLATRIANSFLEWDVGRQAWLAEKREIQQYIFATDTTKTTNAKLPWSNKTTIPKICQIRDNLHANYMAAMFPRKKNIIWEGDSQDDESKKEAIEAYMCYVTERNEYYDEISKLVYDYIDYGNAICTIDWCDGTVEVKPTNFPPTQVGYVGPVLRRINPVDIVINPVAPDFASSPKIVQSFVSLGEVKDMIESKSLTAEERVDMAELFQYMREIRSRSGQNVGNTQTKDLIYNISGFDSYASYLESNYVEVLTFMGDLYDFNTDTFLKNYVIKVVDRHKIFSKRPNPSFFGTAPLFHSGWRVRQDNLWAMGPLDNLIGMQYRIDHLENMKADVFDLIAYPPLKIKGYVDPFTWGPFEKILIGDDSDVELMSPPVQALQADNQIAILEQKMEEMAGSPKEAMGFRTPGEKTAYEVQRLENAASRIFQSKIAQFERQITEKSHNGMLELSRRKMSPQTIRLFNDDFKIADFMSLTPEDITGNGTVKPVAARHFAEQAIQLQNINNFYTSAAGHDPSILMHFSSVETAKFFEGLLDLKDTLIVQPYVRISEQAKATQLQHASEEQTQMQLQTPTGYLPGDHDANALGGLQSMGGAPQGQTPSGPPGLPSGY